MGKAEAASPVKARRCFVASGVRTYGMSSNGLIGNKGGLTGFRRKADRVGQALQSEENSRVCQKSY